MWNRLWKKKRKLSCRAQDLEMKSWNDFKICLKHFIFSWISSWFPLFQCAKWNCMIAWCNNHATPETFYQIVILRFECWSYKSFKNIFSKRKKVLEREIKSLLENFFKLFSTMKASKLIHNLTYMCWSCPYTTVVKVQ